MSGLSIKHFFALSRITVRTPIWGDQRPSGGVTPVKCPAPQMVDGHARRGPWGSPDLGKGRGRPRIDQANAEGLNSDVKHVLHGLNALVI